MSNEDALQQMFLEGKRKWPLVQLSFAVFSEHCERVLAASREPSPLREAGDLYLCCACAESDSDALRLFERENTGVVRAAISRIDHSLDFVQETLQEVWDKLLLGPGAKVRLYAGRGPLKAWLSVAATRVALDRYRARKRVLARQLELSDQLAAQAGTPEAHLLKVRFGPAFQRALRSAIQALSSQERNVLRMHVAGQCSIDEIGRAYNVHRATAARWLDRSRTKIYDSVRQELCARQEKLTASEFKSLAALLGSELELSLSGSVHRAEPELGGQA